VSASRHPHDNRHRRQDPVDGILGRTVLLETIDVASRTPPDGPTDPTEKSLERE
jgi:hypothetical protein